MHLLDDPGVFTKHANIKALLATLAAAPAIGTASGLYRSGGRDPLEAGLGGAAGGVTGGIAGASMGAAAMLALQLLAKKQIDPKVLTQAATLAGLLGAMRGGTLGAETAASAMGLTQEALLASILSEMQQQNRTTPYQPDLLR